VLSAVLTLSATGESMWREHVMHAIESTGTTQALAHAIELNGCAG
jgi:hypothetical protein